MEYSGFDRLHGQLLLAATISLMLHAPLLWWGRHDSNIAPAAQPRQQGLAVELRHVPPPLTAPIPTRPELPTPVAATPHPAEVSAIAPSSRESLAEADDTNSTRLLLDQDQAESIKLLYPDAMLPGGHLSLRLWLRLDPEGRVLELQSNASDQSPEVFVGVAEHALQNARLSPALLGLVTLPEQICLEIRFQESNDPGDRVQLRRLDRGDGIAPCLGIGAVLPG